MPWHDISLAKKQRDQRERQEKDRRKYEQPKEAKMRPRSTGRSTRRNPETAGSSSSSSFSDEVYSEVDRFYVIEKLLEKRTDKYRNEQYLVRWQNHQPQHDNWEPREELYD